jgi:adenosyl cobinamide kinase/adenosyl cobinamide phosphate guanylyltransferase
MPQIVQRAAPIATGTPEDADREHRLARARELEREGRWAEARSVYLAEVPDAEERGKARLMVDLLRWAARTHQEAAEFDEALGYLSQAEDVARRHDERVGLGHCLNLRAIVRWQRGDLDEAGRL